MLWPRTTLYVPLRHGHSRLLKKDCSYSTSERLQSVQPRPFLFTSAMQESDERKGAATADVLVDEQPNALIACKVADEVFNDTHVKVGYS